MLVNVKVTGGLRGTDTVELRYWDWYAAVGTCTASTLKYKAVFRGGCNLHEQRKVTMVHIITQVLHSIDFHGSIVFSTKTITQQSTLVTQFLFHNKLVLTRIIFFFSFVVVFLQKLFK